MSGVAWTCSRAQNANATVISGGVPRHVAGVERRANADPTWTTIHAEYPSYQPVNEAGAFRPQSRPQRPTA